MITPKLFILVILLTSIYQIRSFENSHLYILNDTNFDELTKEGKWFLDFYAPWCPHCKKLAPIIETASKLFESEKILLKFGFIDCTIQTGLASRFSIEAYPTLKYYTLGFARDYEGGRELADLVNFAVKISEPELTEVEDPLEFSLKQMISLIFFGGGEELEVVKKVAQIFQTTPDIRFGVSKRSNLISDYVQDTSAPTLIMYSDSGEVEVFSGPFELDVLQQWVNSRKVPYLGKLTEYNWHSLIKSGKLLVIIPVNPNEENSWYLDIMRELSVAYKRKYNFFWIDAKTHTKFIAQYEIREDELPVFLIYDGDKNVYYMNKTTARNKEAVHNFIGEMENGKVQALGHGKGVMANLIYMFNDLWRQMKDNPYLTVFLLSICLFIVVLFFILICTDITAPKEKDE